MKWLDRLTDRITEKTCKPFFTLRIINFSTDLVKKQGNRALVIQNIKYLVF